MSEQQWNAGHFMVLDGVPGVVLHWRGRQDQWPRPSVFGQRARKVRASQGRMPD